jgi:hypothetical protein
VARAIEERNSCDQKLCRISAALRQRPNSDSDYFGFLVIRYGHQRRDASLDSIDIQLPKLATRLRAAIPVFESKPYTPIRYHVSDRTPFASAWQSVFDRM